MALASLAMYDMAPAVRSANDALWSVVRDRLRAEGFSAPERLNHDIGHEAAWLQPDLVFAQTCGYPFIMQLRGRVRLIGTPRYRFAGGSGSDRASFVIVRDESVFSSVEALRGTRAAINDRMSNSGMNLLRALVAPLAVSGRFFSDVRVTGGHLASMAAVREGLADVAAIDSVTYGLAAAHDPSRVAGLKILAETPAGPGLPIITRLDASDAEVAVLRAILTEIATDSRHAAIAVPLGLIGFDVLDEPAYERLALLAEQASALDYPELA